VQALQPGAYGQSIERVVNRIGHVGAGAAGAKRWRGRD
jgi:hypothetical protein